MNRKGTTLLFFMFMATLVTAVHVGNLFIFNEFVDTLNTKTSEKSVAQSTLMEVREELMHAECATQHRGIFYLDAVTSPDRLNCITTEEPITISFEWEDDGRNIRIYDIDPGDHTGTPTVTRREDLEDLVLSTGSGSPSNNNNAPITIYDEGVDQYQKGVLGYRK